MKPCWMSWKKRGINDQFFANLSKAEQEALIEEYTFKAIPRLLGMIPPTDRAKSYCQKLIDSLEQEGYSTDAKIVRDCLKQMNGEKVAMATMDEQKPWSEEDEETLKIIDRDLQEFYSRRKAQAGSPLFESQMQNVRWLKSLRPHSQWKPSDEQMKVCKEVYADILSAKGFDLGTINGELNRLEEELKKLKG